MLYEIHMLKNYPPANLNRDDTGMSKTCYFGGAQRGRISSQCLKRAWRTSPLFEKFLGPRGIRTRRLPERIAKELKKRGIAEDIAAAVRKAVSEIAKSENNNNDNDDKENKTKNKKSKEETPITSQILFCSNDDITAVADAVETLLKKNGMKGNNIKAKEILEQIKDADIRPLTLDIALFGRMVTSKGFINIKAAVQTAHAISTHAVNSESDYFTAVDETISQNDVTDRGAAHLDTTDYNSCCYYHYIAIDTDVLKQNLVNSPEAQKLMDEVLPAFIQIMAYTDPSGKQNSFASHVLPELLCVEIKEKKIPVSYANAYASPVNFSASGRVIGDSVKALVEEIDRIDESYGLEVKHRFWSRRESKTSSPENAKSLRTWGNYCSNAVNKTAKRGKLP